MDKHRLPADLLAKKVGVANQTIFNWRSGKSQPSRKNLQKLADVLQVDPQFLVESTEKKSLMHLRKLLEKKLETNLEDIDIPTMLAVMRTLGYNIVAEQNVKIVTPEEPIDDHKELLRRPTEPSIGIPSEFTSPVVLEE